MGELVRPSGLVITRGVVPRDNPPNSGGSGVNDPPISVGPTSSEGFGNTHVLYDENQPAPPEAQAWSGWPVGWNVPNWSGFGSWWHARTSTVMTCVDTIGRACSTFALRAQKGNVPLEPQPTWTINPEPALYANVEEWEKATINSLLLRGEAFIASTAKLATDFPARFITLNPDLVNVENVDGRAQLDLAGVPLDPADVLHVCYQRLPGSLRGIGPLDWIARNVFAAEAMESYGSDLAASGGIPWGVLTHPGNLREGQAQTIRDQWKQSSQQRGTAPAILSGGMTLQTLSLSPESMALLSLREFDEQRIAAAFGVPPMFVGLPQPSGLNYTSTSMLNDFFYRNTLRPMLKNLGDALGGWALPRGTDCLFDASDYTRPDLPAYVAAMVQLHSIVDAEGFPAISVEEIRASLNLPAEPTATPATTGVTA